MEEVIRIEGETIKEEGDEWFIPSSEFTEEIEIVAMDYCPDLGECFPETEEE